MIPPARGRRGELSFQIIVIAALCLLILVILAIIITGRFGVFNKSLSQTCTQQGGVCAAADPQNTNDRLCDSPDYPIKIFANGCSDDGSISTTKDVGPCCLPLARQGQ
ncbi:hypothetical protein JXB02_03900 [Candidatus Woesearchaeota archaeon]|nr:hypothetical protein [Candidatus Woesearchaeota archaeon]